MISNFYKEFEDHFRGSRETIKARLKIYLPLLEPLKTIDSAPLAIDVGCGRGEWLELLNENGFKTHGIDQDTHMLKSASDSGLSVEQGDAIAYLKTLSEGSVALVTGFHIAEHLHFDDLLQLIHHAHRVLKPGGLLILETPNPENIGVGSNTFYTDPTHNRPLPPALLSFLPSFSGFERTNIFRLNGKNYDMNIPISTFDVIAGASPDYAVIAQKNANMSILSLFDGEMFKKHGFSMDELALRHGERTNTIESNIQGHEEKITDLFDKVEQIDKVEQRVMMINDRMSELDTRFEAVSAELGDVYGSRSWKITKPLRWGIRALRQIRGFVRSLPFREKNRIKSMIGYAIRRIIGWVREHPHMNALALRIAHRFPAIIIKIKKIHYDGGNVYIPIVHSGTTLTPRASRIYQDLKRAMAKADMTKGEK